LEPATDESRGRPRGPGDADDAIRAWWIDFEETDEEPSPRAFLDECPHNEQTDPISILIRHRRSVRRSMSRVRQRTVIAAPWLVMGAINASMIGDGRIPSSSDRSERYR
jgi:hypothetical protein